MIELFQPEDLDARELRLSLRYAVELDIVYANNPKCACSTVKASLLKKIDELNGHETNYAQMVHSQEAYARLSEVKDDESIGKLRAATSFSVVRNPFKRAVSAYLDKVGSDRKDQRIWNWTHTRYGLRPELSSAEFSFKDFLRLMLSDDTRAIDPHFRPQVYNLFWGHMRWDQVARLETPEEMNGFLEARGMEVKRVDHHKTGSGDVVYEYLDDDAVDLIREFYALDFEHFGYSTDPSSFLPIGDATFLESDDRVYTALSRNRKYEVGENDAPIAKFRKARKIGEKIDVISSELDGVNDYNTAYAFSNFINTMIAKNKTATISLEELSDLGRTLDTRVAETRANQIAHIGADFFAT